MVATEAARGQVDARAGRTDSEHMTRAEFETRVPEGDDREREVCTRCGFIDYDNPKIVVGSVATWGDRVLLCRRAIDPRAGFWTLPAGYLEHGETPEEGARREAREEALADLSIRDLLAVYTVRRLGQVQLMYRATLRSPEIGAGPESAEVGLFAWDEIPRDAIAFPTVRWALAHFRRAEASAVWVPATNPEGESTRIEDMTPGT